MISESQFYTSLGARIYAARCESGISQAALGKELGVTFQQIQKYEKGQNSPSLYKMIRIQEILKCNLWEENATEGNREILELIKGYNKLSKPQRNVIRGFIHELKRS